MMGREGGGEKEGERRGKGERKERERKGKGYEVVPRVLSSYVVPLHTISLRKT
jgi:hypothetical protein